jgi:putative glutamine amidotransferase
MTPLIGITCGTSSLDLHAKNPQDRLNTAYTRAVSLAGGAPVILPNRPDSSVIGAYLDRLDGLLLTGGFDVNPRLFGEKTLNGTVEIDHLRDDAELPLIRAALQRDLPIFAICRGIQTLNVCLGGTLYQDIPSQIPSHILHVQSEPRPTTTHSIEIESASRLADIVRARSMPVNSMHHQALKDVAPGLVVVARAEDGVVEAAEVAGKRFVLAVQFHPEEMVGNSEGARWLFAAFVEECSSDSVSVT